VLSIDITSPTFSVGYAANSVPRVAKQNAVNIMEMTRISACAIGVWNMMMPMANGRQAMPRL